MEELVKLLVAGQFAPYAVAGASLFKLLAPASLTKRIPDVIMIIINAVAMHSDKSTDFKGNPKK